MDAYDYLGNPELKVESSKQIEIKYTYTQKQWKAFVQVYHHLQNNYIYPYLLKDYYAMTIGAKGVKTYKNIEEASSTGFEYGLQWRMGEHWQFNQTGRYIYAKTSWGEPLPLVSPLTFYNSLRYKRETWQAQVDYEYHAPQNRINTDFNERSSPAYQLMHLRLAKLFYSGKHTFQLTAACENVLNADYHDHLDIGYVPRMGRNFQLGLNYSLF
jgi:iron complex outermembrane receptor protein